MATLVKSLDHPAYHKPIKLRGYNGRCTAFQAVSNKDAANILFRANPDWSTADHAALSEQHLAESDHQKQVWNDLLEAAAQETFGRPYQISDYRISGISCEEFSEEKKDALRFAIHSSNNHATLARAHAKAARKGAAKAS